MSKPLYWPRNLWVIDIQGWLSEVSTNLDWEATEEQFSFSSGSAFASHLTAADSMVDDFLARKQRGILGFKSRQPANQLRSRIIQTRFIPLLLLRLKLKWRSFTLSQKNIRNLPFSSSSSSFNNQDLFYFKKRFICFAAAKNLLCSNFFLFSA